MPSIIKITKIKESVCYENNKGDYEFHKQII